MSSWDQRIRDHSVKQEIAGVLKLLESLQGERDHNTLAALGRLRSIVTFCRKRLDSADPLLTPIAPLDDVAHRFSSMRGALENFSATKDAGHLEVANETADTAISDLLKIPQPSNADEMATIISSVFEYRTAIERGLSLALEAERELRQRVEALSTRIDELAGAVQYEQQRITQIVSDHQSQFSEAQERRNQDYLTVMKDLQQELARIMSEQQGQFSSAQDIRGREFNDAQGIRQEKFNDTVAGYSQRLTDAQAEAQTLRDELQRVSQEKLNALNSNYEREAEGLVQRIEDQRRHVEKLVGVIGNLGVTSGYKTVAISARRTMWFWQSVTIVAMGTLCFLAYTTLVLLEPDKNGQFNWGAFAGRVILLGSLGVIAAYAGAQADKQFTVERRNRRLSLELEAIGPFLAPLSEEEQNKFRLHMGDRSFGREEASETTASPATLIDLLNSKSGKELVSLLTELAKKIKG